MLQFLIMFKRFLQKFFPFLFSTTTYLAFGVEESPNKYPLDKARYLRIASYIHQEYLSKKRPLKVLDIGCSEGMMLLYCKKNNSEVDFYGIDILEERKNKAMARGYKAVALEDIRQCDFRKYGEDFFDIVICSHILEHLEHPGDILEKIKDIVRDKALLIVGVPIGLLPGMLWAEHIIPIFNARKRKEEVLKRFGHVNFFTLPKLRELLKHHGFVMEEARGDYLIRSRKFFLENCRWWFELNQWYGKLFPGVLGHVMAKARLNKKS
ncbi:MAG: hypothetical protein COV71_03655 [Candidatus Omnitrophica bacterium CG11_big_fil_rev_8_21_14_0_20_41_12]|nr:MAG: hypothetical protein COV71_03655 [Candidatus Omnitrophica bacterium CG11_big_fil_rev_8_21_14_0_20_41_12]